MSDEREEDYRRYSHTGKDRPATERAAIGNALSQLFEENLSVLRNIAKRLKSGEATIDDLVGDVTKAAEAYEKCKVKLQAVEDLVNEKLPGNDQPEK